jgi:hypothetical protein
MVLHTCQAVFPQLKMKKIIYLLTLVLLATSVLAQDIRISVIEYTPEKSDLAKIMVRNHGTEPYRDITYTIEDGQEQFLVGILTPGNAAGATVKVPSGATTITVKTDKGTFQQQLILQEATQSTAIKREVLREEIQQQLKEKEQKEKLQKGLPYLILVILVIIAYLLYRHFKK